MSTWIRWAFVILLVCHGPVAAWGETRQTVVFRIAPSDAEVVRLGPPDVVLGVAGTPLSLSFADSNTLIRLRFVATDFQSEDVELHGYNFLGQTQYPPPGMAPITLRPGSSWVVLKLWVEAHGILAAALLLAALGAVGGAVAGMRRLRQMHHEVVVAPSRAVETDRVGTSMGPYRLVEWLGEGGTAEVYRGVSDTDGREVAVKIIRQAEGVQTTQEARFRREIQILEHLHHPAIVRLLDHGVEQNALYLVEELVSGGDLGDRIPPKGVSIEEFFFFRPVVEAVCFAHERGIVHRDLKPDNVLLTPDGRVKLTDFGLAKTDASTSFTTNNIMGTPTYMSPEQFSGQPAGPLSDQYSLGIIAYQMLAGHLPFPGDTISELMARRLQDPPPMADGRGVPVPAPLDAMVLRMLSRRPEARYPTVRDILTVLDAAARQR